MLEKGFQDKTFSFNFAVISAITTLLSASKHIYDEVVPTPSHTRISSEHLTCHFRKILFTYTLA